MAKIKQRPEYHFTPQKGWINDPNGLYFLNGFNHILYQANRSHTHWASPSIGHARTKDFIHFVEMDDAVCPDSAYDLSDEGGCFSGSIINKDARLFLVYTGSVNSGENLSQSQNLAVSLDGVHFEKYLGNPIIPTPPPESDLNFRDPKVFEHDSKYYMVTGCRKNGHIAIFLYSSLDLIHWGYQGVLYEGNGEDGTLAECPDLYPIHDDYWLLTFSPEHHRKGIRSLGIIGKVDLEGCSFSPCRNIPLDYGLDYYARQSYRIGSRRISIAWLNQWPWMTHFQNHGNTTEEGWCGCLGMPREETYDGGSIKNYPVEEVVQSFKLYKRDKLTIKSVDSITLKAKSSSFLLSLSLPRKEMECGEITVKTASFTFLINVERSYIVVIPMGKNSSVIPISDKETTVIDFFFDNSVLEMFVDGGEESGTWIFERTEEKTELEFLVKQKSCQIEYSLSYLEETDEFC